MPQHTLPATPPRQNVEDMTFDLPQPEPIKGFPELRWTGKRPFTSTHYYPAQLKERYGDPVDGWMNRIYWGDNLQVMSHLLKEFRGKVDLVYIDPPFDSKADYKKTITLQGRNANSDSTSFEEKQYIDIWSNDEYLQFLYERLIIIREILSENGTLYIHLDAHKFHAVKIILDEIFGINMFINQIAWKRATTVKGNIGQGSKFFGDNMDYILIYSKSKNYIFNNIYTPYSDEYINSFFKYSDNGRRYSLTSMTAPGGEEKGNPFYEVMGIKRHWRYSQAKMNQMISEGLVVQTSPGNVPRRKQFLDEGLGVPIQTLWDDVPGLAAQSTERVFYPTQKPEALLERIIKASSNPGSIVLDCFMGSGTTQAVAMKLGRRFIGADINLGAIQTTTKRLNGIIAEKKQARPSLLEGGAKPYLNFEVYNVNHYDVFRNPVQARDLLLQALEIEPLESTDVFDGMKDGYKVRIMPVNRIATRADLNPILNGINYREMEKRMEAAPGSPAERIMLVCMGHEPDLAASLKMDIGGHYSVDVKVVDILRDRKDLTFKYDSEADTAVENGELIIRQFYPRNLLQKLSILEENVEDWRQLVETVA
uniref:site-specific DNA-methyltransferase n=1 Tax=Desulfovibrio sp. ZJ369 TaxID=2709793 RepID=UPI00197DAA3F